MSDMPKTIFAYVVRNTGRHQIGLAILSAGVFLLSAVPLELQRRIVNTIVEHGRLATITWLAGGYAGLALVEQSLKLLLNIYRGWVAEGSVRALRLAAGDVARLAGQRNAEETGLEIAVMLEEVEPIGGFTGISVSEPLLQGGVLASVIGYMLYLDLRLTLLALAFFIPQTIFVPLLQRAINRRAQSRIVTKRGLSGDIVKTTLATDEGWNRIGTPIQQVFALNMSIYKLKFAMNLFMNLMHHFSVAVALGVGGWLALAGRIEVGTVVAIVGGMGKLNDPWGDLVNWARELSVVSVKYRLFLEAMARLTPARPESS